MWFNGGSFSACYFNSLVQTLFQIKEFVVEIFKYKEPADLEGLLAKLDIKDEIKERKRVILLASKRVLIYICSLEKCAID